MASQIEIFSPYDPIIKDMIEKSKIEYAVTYVDIRDNKTGDTYRLYPTESEKKKLFDNPDKYMKEYFEKHPNLVPKNKK